MPVTTIVPNSLGGISGSNPHMELYYVRHGDSDPDFGILKSGELRVKSLTNMLWKIEPCGRPSDVSVNISIGDAGLLFAHFE